MQQKAEPKKSPWADAPEVQLDENRFEWNHNCKKGCRGLGYIGYNLKFKEIIPCKCLKLKEVNQMDVSGLKNAPNLLDVIKEIFGGNKKSEDVKKPAPEEKK